MNEKLEVLMPVHNEAKAISKIIPDIHQNIGNKIEYSFIICEDGSTDNSLKTLIELKKKFSIKLISSDKKKGYSIAVLDGIKEATADYLLVMDSDGQSNPDEILNFWANRNKANLVNGNRTSRHDYMYRKLYSNIA